MNEIKFKVTESINMINLGYILTPFTYPNLVISLTGDLGAGKTTFTKGIGKALGIKRVINSPTFTIMKIYDAEEKINGIEKLYHLDVYRLNDSSEDDALSEYFYLDGLTIIEWADIIKDLLPSTLWKINITNESENSRIVSIIFNDHTNIELVKEALRGNNYEIINW